MSETIPRKRFLELPMDARREILRLQAELLVARQKAIADLQKREHEIARWWYTWADTPPERMQQFRAWLEAEATHRALPPVGGAGERMGEMSDPLIRLQVIAEMSDETLLWELECRGYPEELLQPLRDFVRQPVPSWARLAVWTRSAA